MPNRSSGNFGRTLREARERRGVSLRQISNATKIGMSALEALERNDFSRLPGGLFSRAFVRSYAIEVGLDPDATLQEFMAQFPHVTATAGHAVSTLSEDHQAIDSDRRSATTFVRLILLSIPIAGALIYFGVAGRRAAAPAQVARPAAEPALPVAEPAVPSEDSTEPVAEPALESAAESASAAAVPSDLLTVALSVTGKCWVSATVDGEKKVERLMQPGEQLAMEVRRELVLTAGDASALAITLNGQEAKALGKPGEVVTARLNLTNFRDYVAER
jgi:cytoskeleton protein RodZ